MATTRAPDPYIVVDRDLLDIAERAGFALDPDDMRVDKDGLPDPCFTVIDLSKFFFGMSPDWVRYRIRKRFFAMGGDPACEHGVQNVPTGEINAKGEPVKYDVWWFTDDGVCEKCGAVDYGSPQRKSSENLTRVYSLADVERMTYALHVRQVIDSTKFLTIMRIVKACASIYGYSV